MKDLVLAAKTLQTFCEDRGWQFCIIGGVALQVWGENRLTLDVDLTLFAGFGDEENYIDQLIEEFPSRISDAREFALLRRVILLESPGGIGFDISLGAFDFEALMVERSVYVEFLPGLTLKVCTAEDLIVSKAFAARPKDWIDIESILIKQSELDWDYILRQLTPLAELKEAPEILENLSSVRQSCSGEN